MVSSYIEKILDSIKKELMKKVSKVAGYKINKWKSVVFLYTNELFEKKILSDPIYNSKKKTKQ